MHTFEASVNQEYSSSHTAATKSSMKNEDEINKLITNHKSDDVYLDLMNRSLSVIPPQLFILPHIQHLYLEGNNLTGLPENFFDRLPALVWLDLRNNKLKSIPPSIGKHQSIKNLLLEGNCLTQLPLHLGLTKTLNGLNLRGNPLVIPPPHIVDQGVYVILSYLYQELQTRTKPQVEKEVEKLQISEDTASSSDEEILTEAINFTGRNIPSPMSDDFELVRHGPTPMSASLHKPITYQDYKGRFQTSGLVEGLRNKISRGGKKELSLVELKQQEETRQDQLKVMKERQSALADQRRKNIAALGHWRNETRKRQVLSRSKTETNLKPPPYGIDANPIEVHENVREERVERVLPEDSSRRKQHLQDGADMYKRSHMIPEIPNKLNEGDVKKAEENEQEKQEVRFTGAKANSVAKKNEAVQQRIKQHANQIQHRLKEMRREQQPENKRQIKELQRQLLERKMSKDTDLEYRFRAFTGDSRSSSNKTSSM